MSLKIAINSEKMGKISYTTYISTQQTQHYINMNKYKVNVNKKLNYARKCKMHFPQFIKNRK